MSGVKLWAADSLFLHSLKLAESLNMSSFIRAATREKISREYPNEAALIQQRERESADVRKKAGAQ